MDNGAHSEQFESRLSTSSHMVSEIASFSDDYSWSSSIEEPLPDDDYPGDEQHCNTNEDDTDDDGDGDYGRRDDYDDGNEHSVTTTEDKVGKASSGTAQEQRKPNTSRVAARLNQAKTGYNNTNTYRRPDLQPLEQDYCSLKKCWRSTLNAAKAYCEATKELRNSKNQVRATPSDQDYDVLGILLG